MLRLAVAVGALLLTVTLAQARSAKHSFSGLCAYYPGRGGGLIYVPKTTPVAESHTFKISYKIRESGFAPARQQSSKQFDLNQGLDGTAVV